MDISISLSGMASGTTGLGNFCQYYITSPVDATVTVAARERACSNTSVEVDSVAAGAGEVVINGTWSLT